ncbi:TolC family protein [Thermosulfuriphilus sp.]
MVSPALGQKLGLEEAKELALKGNPLIKAAEAESKAAQAGVSLAKSRFWPRLDLSQSYIRSNSPPQVFSAKLSQEDFHQADFALERLNHPSPLTNLRTELIITQPIFNRGEEITNYRLARIRKEMALVALEQTRQQVLLQVEEAFLNWLLSIDAHEVVKMALETARANLKTVSARYQAGSALKSDLLQAEVYLASLEKEELAARNRIQVALSALNLAMGTPPEKFWEPKRPQSQINPQGFNLTKWTEVALERRPEARFFGLLTEAAKWRVKRAKMEFLPALNLQGIYEYNTAGFGDPSGDAWTVIARADFNLFKGLGDVSALRKARAELLKAESRQRDILQRIKHQVREAFLNLETARAQVEVTRKAVSQAQEGLGIVEKRYSQGLTIITELLDAQTALKKARLEHLEALYSWRLAWSRLRYTAGLLSAGALSQRMPGEGKHQ